MLMKEKNLLKKKIYFEVMEYAENGELKDYISNKKTRIPEKISSKIFYRMVSVIKYLHENNITHCDIKPENILMCKNFVPKLNDFGFSHIFEHKNGEKDWTLFHFAGSVIYSGPEIRKPISKTHQPKKDQEKKPAPKKEENEIKPKPTTPTPTKKEKPKIKFQKKPKVSDNNKICHAF